MKLAILLGLAIALPAEDVRIQGLYRPVEVLRDRWGVPHIYAESQEDLFFAQGYMAARDRLYQIDLWRRQGSGKLAEVLGPEYVERDRTALLLRFRGDWKAEWASYSPDTWEIVNAFVRGINAYIQMPGRKPTADFRKAGYEPGLWEPNDVVARLPVFSMTSNFFREARRAREADAYGLAALQKWAPPDPPIKLDVPLGLNLKDILMQNLAAFDESSDPLADAGMQGSNNWAIAGRLSATGKPLLASDPHRLLQIPSIRKTFHLVAPGWNALGSGEPALPGIALGHNETIGFGFTITGTDQQDLYVEQINPVNHNEYLYKGQWKRFETERFPVAVKGERPRAVEVQYTIHGPVVGIDLAMRRAYVLRWVGSEAGTAGYLAGLALARARNWPEFLTAAGRFKAPAENLVYADTAGNIGMAVAGLTPIRPNWSGLFPVPGHMGEYEWNGFLRPEQLPRLFNPPSGFIATANNNILPAGYKNAIQYEWNSPMRVREVERTLRGRKTWTLEGFIGLQQNVVSPAARRLVGIARRWTPVEGSPAASVIQPLREWDARMTTDSVPAALYLMWLSRLTEAVTEAGGLAASMEMTLQALEAKAHPAVLQRTLDATVAEFERALGQDRSKWRYGNLHFLYLRHLANEKAFDRGPIPMPGDGFSVNVYNGPGFRATHGSSFRMVLDVSNWDASVMTNAPGESGDPESPHYDDLLEEWAAGRYHPMPFSRRAVEAAARERIHLIPR